jgi:hypothetical membrane protein
MTSTIQSMPASVVRAAAAGRAWATDLRLGGSLLAVAGVTILMGIITAEALYPNAYTTGGNEISDLGGTRPPNSLIFQPSAMIFDLSMVAIGILVMVGSCFVHRAFGRRSVTIPLTVLGIGALGVGVFPGNTGAPHAIFAMVTFVAGGVAAISAARVTTAPFRFVSLLLGAVSLLTLASYILLGDNSPMAAFGIGGIERWIVYPVILWVIAFGGYLSGRADGDPSLLAVAT